MRAIIASLFTALIASQTWAASPSDPCSGIPGQENNDGWELTINTNDLTSKQQIFEVIEQINSKPFRMNAIVKFVKDYRTGKEDPARAISFGIDPEMYQ